MILGTSGVICGNLGTFWSDFRMQNHSVPKVDELIEREKLPFFQMFKKDPPCPGPFLDGPLDWGGPSWTLP